MNVVGIIGTRPTSQATIQRVTVVSNVNPTALDDSSEGYDIGKRWVNTATNATFTLTDNTAGAAVWVEEDGSGGGGGPLPASSVTYTNAAVPGGTSVKDALDQIFYVTPAVTSFTNTAGTVEKGTTVTALTLNWSYNKSVVSQSIDQGIGSLSAALRTLALTGLGLTADTTYHLTGNDGVNNATGSTSVLFRQRRRWGTSAVATPDAALIDALSGAEFSTTRNQSRTFNPAAEYIYFAWPSSFGTPTFTVNGLLNTGYVKTTISYTNPSGYTENWDVWRSGFALTGSGINVVVT